MYGAEPSLLSVLVVAGLGAFWVYERYQEYVEPSDEEAIRQAYAEGDIDEAEMERRLAYQLDERNEEIVEALTPVPRVGPKTGRAIAERFESIDGVRSADREELEAVHGVGEKTADEIQRWFGS